MDVTGPQPGEDGFKDWPAMYGGAEAAEEAIEATKRSNTAGFVAAQEAFNDHLNTSLKRAIPLSPEQVMVLIKSGAEQIVTMVTAYSAMPPMKSDIITKLREIMQLAMLLEPGPVQRV